MDQFKSIHHISHIDLDGWVSTSIVNSGFSNSPIELVQTNADYHELTDHLREVLEQADPDAPIDILLITDLNLKMPEAEVLKAYSDRYQQLVLLDHHQNASDVLEVISNIEGIQFYPTINHEKSGAMLTWEFMFGDLTPSGLATLTNIYDLYQVDHPNFMAALTLSDYVMEMRKAAIDVLSPAGVRELIITVLDVAEENLYFETVDEGIEASDLWFDLVGVFHGGAFAVLRDSGYLHPSMVDGPTDEQKYLSPMQMQSLCIAGMSVGPLGEIGQYLHTASHDYYGELGVIISDKPLARGVLFHLMYTLEIVGIYVMKTKDDVGRIEFRQHKKKEYTKLNLVAGAYGGGGHIGAAGCHIGIMPWDHFVTELKDRLKLQFT